MSTLLEKANAIKQDKDTNLLPQNLRLGVECLGVVGNLAPDKPDQTKTANPSTNSQTITADTGYELASVTINPVTSSIDANITPGNIKKDVSILGVTGIYEGSGGGGSGQYKLVFISTQPFTDGSKMRHLVRNKILKNNAHFSTICKRPHLGKCN